MGFIYCLNEKGGSRGGGGGGGRGSIPVTKSSAFMKISLKHVDYSKIKSKVQMHIMEDLSSRVNSVIHLLVNCLEFTRINAL